jgi:hypothetical protein
MQQAEAAKASPQQVRAAQTLQQVAAKQAWMVQPAVLEPVVARDAPRAEEELV